MKIYLMLAGLFATTTSLSYAEDICHHCEDIREYNAKHHENFEYYDDYLKVHPEEKKVAER